MKNLPPKQPPSGRFRALSFADRRLQVQQLPLRLLRLRRLVGEPLLHALLVQALHAQQSLRPELADLRGDHLYISSPLTIYIYILIIYDNIYIYIMFI